MNSRLTFGGELPPGGSSVSRSNPDHAPGLPAILALLTIQKRLIGGCTAIAALAGLLLAWFLPLRYTAVTRMMPPRQAQSAATLLMSQMAGNGAGALAALAGSGLALKDPNDLYIGLLKSRPVADAIIAQFHLQSVYKDRDTTGVRKDLANNTQITSEKSGSFIVVAVTDSNPARAAEIANAYTDQLALITGSLAISEASQRRLYYDAELTEARERLTDAEVRFERIEEHRRLIEPGSQAKVSIESLSSLREATAAKRVELDKLRSYSTASNPQLVLAQIELSSIQSEITRMEEGGDGEASFEPGLSRIPEASREYLQAEHEVKYRQALYDFLQEQSDAAHLDEAKEAAVIQVVEKAIPPEQKSAPDRVAIVVLFALSGLFVSLVWVLGRDACGLAYRDRLLRPKLTLLWQALASR